MLTMAAISGGGRLAQSDCFDAEMIAGADSPYPLVHRWDLRLVNLLTVIGFGIPILGYWWLVGRFSVDTIAGDQWDDVTVIRQSYVHFFDWGPMWAQHNENRIFFPNAVVIVLAHTAHFDVQLEEYLGAIFLTVAAAFILWTHKRRSASIPWLYYCPVAFLAFSVVQYGNTLWGFQLAWFMVLLALATSLLLLDQLTPSWFSLGLAVVVSAIGSYSSLQGLLIWPTGLVILYSDGDPSHTSALGSPLLSPPPPSTSTTTTPRQPRTHSLPIGILWRRSSSYYFLSATLLASQFRWERQARTMHW